jgi:aspartyl-tRNA(Asn)/glutamyl-tRNA(Gln) amidotransferase subunit C
VPGYQVPATAAFLTRIGLLSRLHGAGRSPIQHPAIRIPQPAIHIPHPASRDPHPASRIPNFKYHSIVATFTRDAVQRLARLARLELTAEELELFARQLGDILTFARQIQAVDTTTAPDGPAGDPADALRDDLARPCLDRGDVLRHAPDADRASGLFKVPRVLNG